MPPYRYCAQIVSCALASLSLLCGCKGNFEPCARVDCDGHGHCLNDNDRAVCVCDPGYHDEGTRCLPSATDGDGDVDGDSDGDVDGDSDGDSEGDGGCTPLGAETCNGLDDDCDGQVDEDFDLLRDPLHCGSCERTCPLAPPRAAPACVAGECALSCDEGFADCNGSEEDGCEANLLSAATCGTCTNVCVAPTPLCRDEPLAGRHCVAACPDELIACGDSCVDLTQDPLHCGDCETECPAPPDASAACRASSCDFVCDEGHADCDEEVPGCEASLTSTASCGSCGNACVEGELCDGTECVPACPPSCTCERVCDRGEPCECGGGCPCLDWSCVDTCRVRCRGAGTVCAIDATAATRSDYIDCEDGARALITTPAIAAPQFEEAERSRFCEGRGDGLGAQRANLS